MNVYTEKNKLAPSQYSVPLVFDKKFGAIPILSEYIFMRDITKVERKYWKTANKLVYPLCITTSANSKILTVTDPTTQSILYKSDKFMERNFLNKYRDDQEFQHWFNKAVDISVDQRIKVALFRDDPASQDRAAEVITAVNEGGTQEEIAENQTLAQQFDPDVNPVTEQTPNPISVPDPSSPTLIVPGGGHAPQVEQPPEPDSYIDESPNAGRVEQ
jgi:hypothetical protein